MNLYETAQALAQAQVFDQRTVGDADVISWQALLVDAQFDDVVTAIRRHYAEETVRIMPAHVRRIVRDIERERSAGKWAPGQHGVLKGHAHPEVSPGDLKALSDLPAELAKLVRAALPEGNRAALFPRRVAWEREQLAYLRSTRDAEPNPHYKPKTACDWHEKGGYGWTWDCRRCNPDHPAHQPRMGTPCLGETEPHESHTWRIEGGDEFWCDGKPDVVAPEPVALKCRWCHAKTGHFVGCHAYGE